MRARNYPHIKVSDSGAWHAATRYMVERRHQSAEATGPELNFSRSPHDHAERCSFGKEGPQQEPEPE